MIYKTIKSKLAWGIIAAFFVIGSGLIWRAQMPFGSVQKKNIESLKQPADKIENNQLDYSQILKGGWAWEERDASDVIFSFRLSLNMDGKNMTGTYCMTVRDAAKIDCNDASAEENYFRGVAEGTTLKVEFIDAREGTPGKATLTYHPDDDTLEWKLSQSPEGDHLMPQRQILRRERKDEKGDKDVPVEEKFKEAQSLKLRWEFKEHNNAEGIQEMESPTMDAWLIVESNTIGKRLFIDTFDGAYQGKGAHFKTLPKNTLDNFYTWWAGGGEVVVIAHESAGLSVRKAFIDESLPSPTAKDFVEIFHIDMKKGESI